MSTRARGWRWQWCPLVTDSFIDSLLDLNRSDSDVAQVFLEEQLAKYEKLLQQAETRLADFKKSNIGQMPGERGDYFSRFQQEQGVLESLDFQLKLTRQRQFELERQLDGEEPVFGLTVPTQDAGGASVDSAIGRQVQEFEQELAVLRMQYTDSHPDIIRILSILEDLQEQRQKELAKAPVSRGGTLEENPVYQSMKMQLNTVVLEVVELESKRANQARIVNDLRSKIDVIPDIEARLTRLNRDYEVNKSQYDALLRRLETARMTEAAEKSKTQFSFRVIDPPAVTPSPIGPTRVLFMTVVLILSCGAGLALAVFLSFTRPVHFSIRGLEQRFGVPVLGGIQYVQSRSDVVSARRNLVAFLSSCASIFCIYGLVVTFNQAGSRFIGGLLTTLGA